MFKINIICIAKNKDLWVVESVMHFRKLLRKYASVSIEYLADVKNAKALSADELKAKEAESFRNKLGGGALVALTDKGKQYDSIAFSKFIQQLMNTSGRADFLIGGIYGLDQSLIGEADHLLSLSPLTYSHQLVRPILLEQLYRAYSILSGGKYHK